MRKFLALLLTAVMCISFVSCGSKVENVKTFDNLDSAKFSGFINGDDKLIVMYEGEIDEAVMNATLTDENGSSVTISEDLLTKNGDGWSGILFEECEAAAGDSVKLTLTKDGYNALTFTLEVMG